MFTFLFDTAMNAAGFAAHTAGTIVEVSMGAACDFADRRTTVLLKVVQASIHMFGELLESVAKLWDSFCRGPEQQPDSSFLGQEPAPTHDEGQIGGERGLPAGHPVGGINISTNNNVDEISSNNSNSNSNSSNNSSSNRAVEQQISIRSPVAVAKHLKNEKDAGSLREGAPAVTAPKVWSNKNSRKKKARRTRDKVWAALKESMV